MRVALSWIALLLSVTVLFLPFVSGNLLGNEFEWTGAQIIGNMGSPKDNSFAYFVHSPPPQDDRVSQVIQDQGITEADLAKALPFLCGLALLGLAIAAMTLISRAGARMILAFAALVSCAASFGCFAVISLLNEALIRDMGDKLRGAEGTLGYGIGVELLQHISLKPAIGSYVLGTCATVLLLAQALSQFRQTGAGSASS